MRQYSAGFPAAAADALTSHGKFLIRFIFMAGLLSSRWCSAADIDFPEIESTYTIHVSGDTVAEERQGVYQVLAFEGNCVLKQGSFSATANELVLWIEKGAAGADEHPGKTICYLRGEVRADFGNNRQLSDHQWMLRLFSVHPVMWEAKRVTRYDIPTLDWSRDAGSVQLAQFMQQEGRSGAVLSAPPLLQPGEVARETGQSNSAAARGSGIPSIPGALEWNPETPVKENSSEPSTAKTVRTPSPAPGSTVAAGSSPASKSPQPAKSQPPKPSDPPRSEAAELPPPRTSKPRASTPPSRVLTEDPSPANRSDQTSPSSQNLFPSTGIVIPENGQAPFPAAGPSLQRNRSLENPNGGQDAGRREEVYLPQSVGSAPGSSPLAQPATPQVVRQVAPPPPVSAKSVQFLPRSSTSTQLSVSERDPLTGETVVQITGGFKMVVQGIQLSGQGGEIVDYGTVALEADNAVAWLHSDGSSNPLEALSTSTPERPIELYLDGNIVFSQGNRVIYADRMYYNVSSEYGMVLSAEMLTPVPQYQGLLRMKADVLQQRDARTFKAFGAAVTSSRLGVPRYWLQSGDVEFRDDRDETDLSVFAPTEQNRPTNMRATAKSNFVYLGGFPVFYWPTFATNLKEPSFYVTSLRFANDDIFGFQVYSDIDLLHLLGITAPRGTEFDFSVDYLSERGPAVGTDFSYNTPTWLFGIPGQGYSNSWFIYDDGLDTLGADRVNLVPEQEPWRGRGFSRNRLFCSPNCELMLETGYISDRNFLEQYFENEWEQQKDYTTALRLRRYNGNRMFDLFAQARVNDFFTETESLPQFDHYWLGQDLLGQRLTWSEATSVGYVNQRVTTTPTAPQDAAKFQLLPWESDSEGLRALTRQELSLPLELGGWKLVPFVSGEAGYWKEDINQEDVTRLTGQAGIRSSIPFWSVNPNVENRLFDLRGLAHKVNLETEFFYADSSADLSRFPLYDPLDDNAQEHFRRRFIFNTFGGTLPPQFDERFYAFRTGMQRWVTAPSNEIVDDLTQLRVAADQRWQTKRGLPGRERIVDLVSLNTGFTYFPNADRDNFGEEIGGVNYDLRYNVGDRLALLSDGYFDVFSQGLKAVTAGAQISRPGRGNAYLGFLSLEGPISANILNGFVNYRLNEKWIFNGGTAWDFGDTGSIGHNLGFTRIGESALIRVGFNVDSGRDNVVFNFNIEPRFLPTVRLGVVGGELIPPAGLHGLE